ncbi:MAG: site-specific DNA-methyltransferase [Thaumarchaeota archaeon]|nr:site-specific DNA-methyltransferase [Nitrososphaerota archaeon]
MDRKELAIMHLTIPSKQSINGSHLVGASLFNSFRTLSKDKLTPCSLFHGNCHKILEQWKTEIGVPFQCAVTSPPYWGLRDYQNSEQGQQLGAESAPEAFIEKLVEIFSAVREVLADDGVLWLNVGDSYTSGNRGWRAPDSKNKHRAMSYRPSNPPGLKDKELIGIPWKIAAALQASGWYLRSEIIWNKPNCQPESVKDRPTRSHEQLFMFTKQEDYYYDYEFSRLGGRNLRTVWDINTQPVSGDHPATFPIALADRCIRLTSKPGQFVLDPFVGSGSTCIAATQHGRNAVGIDVKKSYLDVALKRLRSNKILLNGKLSLR